MLDLMMPEMDGFEFIDALRAHPRLAGHSGRGRDGQGRHRGRTAPAERVGRPGARRRPRSRREELLAGRSPNRCVPACSMPDGGVADAMAKILLVEDNEMNRDMLSRRLIRSGYEVAMAVDGRAGHRDGAGRACRISS